MKNKIDIGKASTRLVQLCWFVIILCNILKFFGYKDFAIPVISDIELHHIIRKIINCIFYCLNGICFILILVKRKLKLKELLITLFINISLFILSMFPTLDTIRFIIECLVNIILGVLFLKDKHYKIILENIVITLIMTLYQILTMAYKGINIKIKPVDLTSSLVLDIDYYAFLTLTIVREFKKGGYIYGRWCTFLVLLSKRQRIKESIQQNQNDVSQEIGYKIFLVVLSITQIFLVGTICYFINNVILEYFIIIISFFIMRQVFGKSYHADSVLACTTLSVIVFTLATRLTLPQWCSILCNIFIGCMVAYVMYMWYYYAKYTHATGITICKGMSKDNLIALSEFYNWTELEFNILCDYYVYIIRLECIAHKYDYSVDNIKKIKAKALKKLM